MARDQGCRCRCAARRCERGAWKIGAIVDEIKIRKQRVIVALNKTDEIKPQKLLPIAEKLNATGIVDDIFMISALNGEGVEDLKKH